VAHTSIPLFTMAAMTCVIVGAAIGILSSLGMSLTLIAVLLLWMPDWKRGFTWAAVAGTSYVAVWLACSGSCLRSGIYRKNKRGLKTVKPADKSTQLNEVCRSAKKIESHKRHRRRS